MPVPRTQALPCRPGHGRGRRGSGALYSVQPAAEEPQVHGSSQRRLRSVQLDRYCAFEVLFLPYADACALGALVRVVHPHSEMPSGRLVWIGRELADFLHLVAGDAGMVPKSPGVFRRRCLRAPLSLRPAACAPSFRSVAARARSRSVSSRGSSERSRRWGSIRVRVSRRWAGRRVPRVWHRPSTASGSRRGLVVSARFLRVRVLRGTSRGVRAEPTCCSSCRRPTGPIA